MGNFVGTPAANPPGGFDIVLANPPYVRQELIKALKPGLKLRYTCYDGVADLFVYFYERAAQLLRPGGTLAFISSNKWYRAGYGAKLRAFLARETSVQTLVDFGDAPVFGAIAYASILIAVRARPTPGAAARMLTWNPVADGPGFDRLGEVAAARGQSIAQSELGSDGWRLESPTVLALMAKLRANGTMLKEYVDGHFYYGIKTGLNEAFVVDRATRDRLIGEHASSAKVLRPFLRGKDVKRWAAEYAERYLIKIESSANVAHLWSGIGAAGAEYVFQAELPAIHRWLNTFREALIAREDQGAYFWELRSCAYWNKFDRHKILYPDIYEHQSFVWDNGGFVAANTTYFISTADKWLVALLNSRTVEWFYIRVSNLVRGGYLRAFTNYIQQIPIPVATPAEQDVLSALVDRILVAKRAGNNAAVRQLEAEIDWRVFRLYGLTPEEQSLVLESTA